MENTGIVKGTVHAIMQTERVSEKFEKREIVIKTPEPYSSMILVQFANQNVSKLDNITTGSQVEIEVNLKGRAWTNPQGEVKYFNSIEGWKIKTENKTFDTVKKATSAQSFGVDSLPF